MVLGVFGPELLALVLFQSSASRCGIDSGLLYCYLIAFVVCKVLGPCDRNRSFTPSSMQSQSAVIFFYHWFCWGANWSSVVVLVRSFLHARNRQLQSSGKSSVPSSTSSHRVLSG
ncbi:hypothetical protein BC826DRAFT_606553 [Russula brevipes]|nr:hypothetical protein BC826DRAFT_606553 [Russula brevipes]